MAEVVHADLLFKAVDRELLLIDRHNAGVQYKQDDGRDALAAPRAEAAGLQSSAAEAQGRVLTGVPYSCRGDGVQEG